MFGGGDCVSEGNRSGTASSSSSSSILPSSHSSVQPAIRWSLPSSLALLHSQSPHPWPPTFLTAGLLSCSTYLRVRGFNGTIDQTSTSFGKKKRREKKSIKGWDVVLGCVWKIYFFLLPCEWVWGHVDNICEGPQPVVWVWSVSKDVLITCPLHLMSSVGSLCH